MGIYNVEEFDSLCRTAHKINCYIVYFAVACEFYCRAYEVFYYGHEYHVAEYEICGNFLVYAFVEVAYCEYVHYFIFP